MHDDPIDLTPLDPDADPGAEERFVGAVMSRIASRPNPYPAHVDVVWGAWSLARPVLIAVERRPRPGLNVTVTATTTDRMPRELELLELTDAQQGQIRSILVRGRDRVLSVVHDFEPRMKVAMDSTNAEIDAVLTAPQRASLAAYRRAHPPFMDQKIIKEKGNRE